MLNLIIPSIIAKNQKELDKVIEKVWFVKTLQLDIMDGKFIASKSLCFDFNVPKSHKYEAHLMIKNPEEWINLNYKKVQIIIIHIESVKDPKKIIKLIKSKKRKIGIAINPKTSIKKIKPYLKLVYVILVMTVNPGKYGSKFLPEMLRKIKELRKISPKLNIEVDGGINNKTIKIIKDAGANRFVVGSYLQNSKTPKSIYKKLIIS